MMILSLFAAMSVVITLPSALPASTVRDVRTEEANLATIREYYDEPDHLRRLRFIGDTYKQHTPMIADGKEGVASFFTEIEKKYPDATQQLVRAAADGDLVWVHLHTIQKPGDRGMAVANIFKLKDGKVVEHWDTIEQVPETSANQNDIFSSRAPERTGPRNFEQEEANRKVVLEFYKDFDPVRRATLFADNYTQHSPKLANGIQAMQEFHDKMLADHPDMKQTLYRTAAYGDYVWVHFHIATDAKDRGNAVIGIYRLENGKIAEHWDISQPVPERSANANTMF